MISLSGIVIVVLSTVTEIPSTYKLPCRYVSPPTHKFLPMPAPPATVNAPVVVELDWVVPDNDNVVNDAVVPNISEIYDVPVT